MKHWFSAISIAALMFSFPAFSRLQGEESAAPAGVTLKVMTYNLRYANPGDGDNFWPHRRAAAAAVVQRYSPDFFGTQEGLISQLKDLDQALPGYTRFGEDRSGKGTDEHTAIYYLKERFELLETETLWLSDTPKVAASRSWGNTLPRILTWGRLKEKATGQTLVAINVHLDHQSEESRQQSMKMIMDLARERFAAEPVVLTGDFNSPGTTGAVHAIAMAKGDGGEKFFHDAWENAAGKTGPEGTFHGFNGVPGSARIDWILATGCMRPLRAETVSGKVDGQWPSDHFPVFAEFRWAAK